MIMIVWNEEILKERRQSFVQRTMYKFRNLEAVHLIDVENAEFAK